MAILSVLIFGAALASSAWVVWATVRPETHRIWDLLIHGPVVTLATPAPSFSRVALRPIRVRSMTGRTLLRAAA